MKTKIAAAVALACLSSVAFAQSKMGADAGWYVGGHLGQSRTDFNSSDFALNLAGVSESKDDSDTAWKLLLGYNFNENWALEGFYTDLGEPKYKYAGTFATVTGSGEARIRNDAWGLAVKGTIPVHQQWDIYGRLGWTYNRSKLDASFTASAAWLGATVPVGWSADHNRSDAVLGVGVEWKPQKNWGIRLEYENYGRFGNAFDNTGNLDQTGRTDVDMWSLGVVVRF
jgi:OmpA-OmpF porin, OOP family